MSSEKVEGSGRRLLLLLEVIADLDSEFSLKELTARAGLPTTTVHRLLQVLLEAGMVERASGQSYSPGVKLLRLASTLLKDIDVQNAAQPYLYELSQAWRETAVFVAYRPQTRTAAVVDAIAGPHPLRFVIERYTEVSLPFGSFGRAILAHLPEHELDAILTANPRAPLSGRALPAIAEIQEDLARIRREGLAVYEDLSIDVAGLAAPVFGAQGRVVGCIGLAMPGGRFGASDQPRLRAAVADAAQRLSQSIGWTAPRLDVRAAR